ncbi:Flp pilus assembly protein CpaF [Paenibacillus sp. 1P03SA]|uniref:Flp pilus assembly protein CpaF n=1 Tax=Paenibacillus sp. 1P03SA TaxID=3132294 RepID=UPI0039A32B26
MLWNFLVVAVILLLLIGYLIYRLRDPQGNKKEAQKNIDIEKYQLQVMTDFLKQRLNELTSSDLYDLALDEADFERQVANRNTLKQALKECTNGDINEKTYVKDTFFDILIKDYGIDETTVNLAIPFEDPDQLSAQDKFEILMQLYKKAHGYKALSVMIQKYKLDRMKKNIESGKTHSYLVTAQEIDAIYKKEIRGSLSFDDKLQIIVQRIYQYYKGFGVIDEIRDMEIDGVSGGVSSPPVKMESIEDHVNFVDRMKRSRTDENNSVWIMFQGKTIHLSFLSFGSTLELKRVVQNIYKYNNPGQLTESNGFIVNEMADGSRIVVMRPPYADSWAFFNRKFNLKLSTLETWFETSNRKIENSGLPTSFIPYLMKGGQVTVVTGDQGSGKTTLMMAMAGHIYGWLTLRTQEMSFELHLKSLYRERNILGIRQTNDISGQSGMDQLKKTDGMVNVVGEVATDEQASWLVQNAQVAFMFTLASHHAKNFKELIYSLSNSLRKFGMFSDDAVCSQAGCSNLGF